MIIETTDYNRCVVINGLQILINYTGNSSGVKAVKLDNEIIPEITRRWNAFEPGGEVERLRAALAYYANEEIWKLNDTGMGQMPSDVEADGGDIARAALAQSGGVE